MKRRNLLQSIVIISLFLFEINCQSQTQISIASATANVNNPYCAFQMTCTPNGWYGNVPMQSGDYIQFDLGSSYLITKINYTINITSNTAMNGFQIKGSIDGTNFTTISTPGTSSNIQTATVNTNVIYRYIRFTGASYGNAPYNGPVYFYNVSFYGVSSMTFSSLGVTGLITAGTLTSSGVVSAGSFSTNGSVTAGGFSTTGAINAASLSTTGTISAGSGTITTTGAITTGSLTTTGNVGIGMPYNNTYNLAVNGTVGVQGQITAEKVVVQATAWGDNVFNNNYKIKTLAETDKYIKANKHLEGVPTEAQVKDKGIDVAEMNTILLKKVEEMTLLLIEQNKTIETLKIKVEKLENK